MSELGALSVPQWILSSFDQNYESNDKIEMKQVEIAQKKKAGFLTRNIPMDKNSINISTLLAKSSILRKMDQLRG